jgi:hypothetical protein
MANGGIHASGSANRLLGRTRSALSCRRTHRRAFRNQVSKTKSSCAQLKTLETLLNLRCVTIVAIVLGSFPASNAARGATAREGTSRPDHKINLTTPAVNT